MSITQAIATSLCMFVALVLERSLAALIGVLATKRLRRQAQDLLANHAQKASYPEYLSEGKRIEGLVQAEWERIRAEWERHQRARKN